MGQSVCRNLRGDRFEEWWCRRGEPEIAIAGRRLPGERPSVSEGREDRRHRHPLPFGMVERSSLRQQGMAVPEGFEPSIRLFNRITV